MRTILALLASVALAACGEPGEVYPLSEAEVVAKLKQSDMPPGIFGSAAPDARVSRDTDGNVVWIVSQRGKRLMRFVAYTEAVDAENTRVAVEVFGPNDNPEDPINKRFAEHSEIIDLYRDAMTEQVDATLEGRDYEFSRIAGSMMRAAAANAGNIANDMDKAAERSRKSVEEYEARQAAVAEPVEGWYADDTYDHSYGQPTDSGSGW